MSKFEKFEQVIDFLSSHSIKAIIFDVDGVLTDGSINVGVDGKELFKRFDVKDGYGIISLKKAGFVLGIISGRNSTIVENRARELGIDFVYQGHIDKQASFEDFMQKTSVKSYEIAYIGDDYPDYPLMKQVGFSVTPADGHRCLEDVCHWRLTRKGGCGAVRELADLLIQTQKR